MQDPFFDDAVPVNDLPNDSRFWVRHATIEEAEEEEQLESLGDRQEVNACEDDVEIPFMTRPGSFTSNYTRYTKRTAVMYAKQERQKRNLNTMMSFIMTNNFAMDRKDMRPDNPPTHVSLAGGRFKIPDEDLDSFHEHYAWELMQGHKMYMCVRPTPVQKLMFDFDFHHTRPVYARQLEMVAKITTEVVSRFYPQREPEDLFCVVSVASYKRKKDPIRLLVPGQAPVTLKEVDPSADNIVKSGMHIVFPKVVVSVHQALCIRENVIAELRERLGNRSPPANCWETVVDDKIYVESGLRMEGSLKVIVCPRCKRNAKKCPTCQFCGGVGGLEEGRPYRPMICLKGDGTRYLEKEFVYRGTRDCDDDEDRESQMSKLRGIQEVVKDTSIRTPAGTKPDPDFDNSWEGYIEPIDRARVNSRKKKKKKDGTRKQPWQRSLTPEEEQMRNRKKLDRFDSYPIEKVQDFIRSLQPEWENIQVTEMLGNDKGSRYVIVVRGSGSRWCGNIQDYHSSNHIYFTAEKGAMVQMCHKGEDNSSKSVCGAKCSCKNYKSRRFPMPPQMSSAFFDANSLAGRDNTIRILDLARNAAPRTAGRTRRRRPRFGTSLSNRLHAQRQIEATVELVNWFHEKTKRRKLSVIIGSVDSTGLGSKAAKEAVRMGMGDALPKEARRNEFQHVVRGDTIGEAEEKEAFAASIALARIAVHAGGLKGGKAEVMVHDLHRCVCQDWAEAALPVGRGSKFASQVQSSAY